MAEPIGRDAAGRVRVDVAPWQFDEYVLAEADGHATPDQLAVLDADRAGWRVSLQAMLHDAEEHLRNARSIPGDERDQVVADLDSEVRQLKAALARNFPEQVAVREPREAQRAADAVAGAHRAASVVGTGPSRCVGRWPARPGRNRR